MKKWKLLAFTLIAFLVLSAASAFTAEVVIFREDIPSGASLTDLHADSKFIISSENPYIGSNHLKRELAVGAWAWITGISGMNLDLSSLDFDNAFIEFYIDSGTTAIGYMELRLAGPGWEPDSQATIATDGAPGYEKISVMLTDFNVKQLGHAPANLDEFTGGTGMIDRWSIGFGATSDVVVDEVVISDGQPAAVSSDVRLTITWGRLKSK